MTAGGAPTLRERVRRLRAGEGFREILVQRAAIAPGQRVLDLGCGRGALAFAVKWAHPEAKVTGIDVDAPDVERARELARRWGTEVTFDLYDGGALPYPDGSFERVLSSLVVHHLEDKVATFKEVRRVLAPGGRLLLVDFGPPVGAYARLAARFVARFEDVGDNVAGRIPGFLRDAGFSDGAELGYYNTFGGTMTVYGGSKS